MEVKVADSPGGLSSDNLRFLSPSPGVSNTSQVSLTHQRACLLLKMTEIQIETKRVFNTYSVPNILTVVKFEISV